MVLGTALGYIFVRVLKKKKNPETKLLLVLKTKGNTLSFSSKSCSSYESISLSILVFTDTSYY